MVLPLDRKQESKRFRLGKMLFWSTGLLVEEAESAFGAVEEPFAGAGDGDPFEQPIQKIEISATRSEGPSDRRRSKELNSDARSRGRLVIEGDIRLLRLAPGRRSDRAARIAFCRRDVD